MKSFNDKILKKRIAKLYSINPDDMLSRCRKRVFCEAKQMYWFYLKEIIGIHEQSIADLSKYSRANVIQGIDRIKGVIETDKETRKKLEKLKR